MKKKPENTSIDLHVESKSIGSHIDALSEVFTEWFLYNPDGTNDIGCFISDNNISDVITVSDFTDLICGYAFLSQPMLSLIRVMLPFEITESKLHRLNKKATKFGAHEINPSPQTVYAKIKKILKLQKQHQTERQRAYRHKHYMSNRDRITIQNRQYALEHAIEIAKYQQEYRHKHHKDRLEYEAKYRKENAANISESKKKCYNTNKEHYRAHQAAYYAENRDAVLAQQHAKYQERKERASMAKSVCPTYLCLLQMRRNKRAEYLKLFGQRDLVTNASKKCPALQSMDANKCALCNGTPTPHHFCAMQQMAQIPDDTMSLIPEFVAIVNQGKIR